MEKSKVSLFIINKIIVHDVPKHKKDDLAGNVDYSERESDLNPELKTFFKDKIIEAVGKKGFKVLYNPATVSPVPTLIQELNQTPDNEFVAKSKTLAKHLFDIQNGTNPAGIMVIVIGSVEGKKITALLKLERDKGVKLNKNEVTHVINIEEVRELILTGKTRVYKVGFFFVKNDFGSDFDGYVSDNQMEIDYKTGVAQFFVDKFLGCVMYDDTRTITKQFFEVTKDFIVKLEDPVKKAQYYGHLLSYLNKPETSINPKTFANEYLDHNDKQAYHNHLIQNNFTPDIFNKDTELINSSIKKMSIDFENDITIIATKGEIDDKVTITPLENNEVKAEIRSKIKNVR